MSRQKDDKSSRRLDAVVAAARRYAVEREAGYREQALKLYPWVCGRCRREFTRDNVRELTVHHRNHDHDFNPPDGSNWELLCLYCHDNEHQRHIDQVRYGSLELVAGQRPASGHRPFEALAGLLKRGGEGEPGG